MNIKNEVTNKNKPQAGESGPAAAKDV